MEKKFLKTLCIRTMPLPNIKLWETELLMLCMYMKETNKRFTFHKFQGPPVYYHKNGNESRVKIKPSEFFFSPDELWFFTFEEKRTPGCPLSLSLFFNGIVLISVKLNKLTWISKISLILKITFLTCTAEWRFLFVNFSFS